MITAPTYRLRLPSRADREKLLARRGVQGALAKAAITEAAASSPARGVGGFTHWCANHVKIETKDGATPFILWPGQARVARQLVSGTWVLALKGRQVGFTWVVAAYVLWRLTFEKVYSVVVVNQEKQYAYDFIERVRYMYDHLPDWSRMELTKDTMSLLRFWAGDKRTEVLSVAGSSKAARSKTGDLFVGDEGSRIPALGATLTAVLPVLEKRGGQAILMSTSAGPTGDFKGVWDATFGEHGENLNEDGVGPTRFMPMFIHWSEVPGRDHAWYAQQAAELGHLSPVALKQEHPNTIAEAWEHAMGRLFPLFGQQNIGTIQITDRFTRYRSIDWGETKSAYVVLWAAVLDGAPPGFIVSPDCPNTIREMTAWRFDEATGRPEKVNDHTCDAVRYLVTTAKITGLVYIYREVYRLDSLTQGYTPMKEIRELHELSGWVRAYPEEERHWKPSRDAEMFQTTIFDRSLGKMGALFREHGIPCKPCAPLKDFVTGRTDKDRDEVMEGVRLINNLIDGTEMISKRIHVQRGPAVRKVLGFDATESLTVTQRRVLARRYFRGRARQRAGR